MPHFLPTDSTYPNNQVIMKKPMMQKSSPLMKQLKQAWPGLAKPMPKKRKKQFDTIRGWVLQIAPMEEKQARISDASVKEIEELRTKLEKQGNHLSFAVLVNLAVTYGIEEVRKSLLK